ncbi:uncharacterized protein LOC141670572 [Apium graveolens]|uniref:uncharacterized protein LOC141670572 n=1 Tax=Apium graveolens TaxID=4045 RepID=UPI003D7B7707
MHEKRLSPHPALGRNHMKEKIVEGRWAKGEMPISNKEFTNYIYDFSEPVVIELHALLPPPHTRKSNLNEEMMGSRDGEFELVPRYTFAEFMGSGDAKKMIKRRKEKDLTELVDVPSEIFLKMPKVQEEAQQMVFFYRHVKL